MNKQIENLLSEFKVNGKNIPYAFLKYEGKATTYITYLETNNSPVLSADNKPIGAVRSYDFDIYSKSNYLDIINELRQLLIDNGFTWIEDSEDMFEEDTRFFHKTITVEKGWMI